MYRNALFQKGNFVQVIDEDHQLYGEIGEISSIGLQGRYLVKFVNGHEMVLKIQEIALWLGYDTDMKLRKAQLLQLQSLAVDLADKQWFEEIGEILRKLEIHS